MDLAAQSAITLAIIETALAFFALTTRLHRALRILADPKFRWGTSPPHGLVHSSHLLKASGHPIGDRIFTITR
jgi:hypothetical protein